MSQEKQTFTHSDFTEYLSGLLEEKYNVSIPKKNVSELLKDIFSKVSSETVEGKDVKMLGFGTSKRTERKAREGRNPRNVEEIISIPASYSAKVTLEKSLKEAMKALGEPPTRD